ncbi:MAG: hypothetical protein JRG71_04605 [Deltaproteobacteria bacterium]|nr:hypothetical protein [Deltaproteobacteria bacterium]
MVLVDKGFNLDGAVASNSLSSLLWYLLGRAFIVTLFLGGTVAVRFSSSVHFFHLPDVQLVALLFVTFLQICFSLLWLLRWQKRLRLYIQFQLVWDLILSALTVYYTGGVESLFSFLFIFVILSCALMSSRAELYVTIVAAVVLYGGLISLLHYGYLPPVGGTVTLSGTDIIYRLFLNIVAFLLAGLLGSILSVRLRRSEYLLQRNQDDYAELENLNRMILKSIPSGLIVVEPSGQICSFNSAASAICLIDTKNACRMTLAEVFPNFNLNEMQLPVDRGEISFVNSHGMERLIGYNATLITDSTTDDLKTLITFQDLTATKKLEENYQLGERLAAVGKLAAGLAHEIRNPLASLSGSVQLLSEDEKFTPSDQRLINIVSREAARLNTLVTDFLVFAKPRLPQMCECDLIAIIKEVVMLLKSDPIFADVELTFNDNHVYRAVVDSTQIHQVLLNLLVNAVQFSIPPKKICIGIDSETGCFWVDDNGPGVSSEAQKKIFEPFFSTRAEGTGLGLAIVHTIISAHGGTIECLNSPSGGARFQVNL